MNNRIYKYDNIKAILIFLVVIGHMTTDYVSNYHAVRWFTLWIYTFHMPAFIFVSGLLHKKYITQSQLEAGEKGNTSLRWEKIIGFLLCAYALKAFLYLFRTAIGQHPSWSWIVEPGIPWYLIVMAEYEILLFIIRRVNRKVALVGAFVLSAVIGYFPSVGDTLSLSRMVNFLPIFLLGYYWDKNAILNISEKMWAKISSWTVIVVSVAICYLGPWSMYSLRKWFTGRRSYEFLEEFFPGTMPWAWAIRLGIWAIAIVLTLAIVIVVPNRELKFISVTGERSLSVYFWHRPICYWLCGLGVFPTLVSMCGGNDAIALIIYVAIALVMTELFSLKAFIHPAGDLQQLAAKVIRK